MPNTINKKCRVLVFGNCQSRIIAGILKANLDRDKYDVDFLINNVRSKGFKGEDAAYSTVAESDILICQPLGKRHGKLAFSYIQDSLKNKCKFVTYPYIFNSGIQSLGYVVNSQKNSYGEIYGSEAIVKSISDIGYEATVEAFKAGNIDFSLMERFNFCIDELRRREVDLDIKLTDYILENYQHQQLFISHNHPTKTLFKELVRQAVELLDICPGFQGHKRDYDNIKSLIDTGAGYSPHDAKVHNYQFGYHSDWSDRGIHLIEMIYKAHFLNQEVEPKIYESSIKYPDVKADSLVPVVSVTK